VLWLPSLAEITRFSLSHAEKVIARHNRLWRSQHRLVFHGSLASHRASKPVLVVVKRPVLPASKMIVLNKRMNQTAIDISQLKKETDKRFKAIEAQTQALENQLRQENNLLSSLTNMVANIDKILQDRSLPNDKPTPVEEEGSDEWVKIMWTDMWIVVGGVLFVLLLGFIILSRLALRTNSGSVDHAQHSPESPTPDVSHIDSSDDKGKDEEEYDYWGSREGVLAKLDLARAYIDMGEIQQAKETLQEVIQKGSDLQKEEALHLLSKLNGKTS